MDAQCYFKQYFSYILTASFVSRVSRKKTQPICYNSLVADKLIASNHMCSMFNSHRYGKYMSGSPIRLALQFLHLHDI